MDEDLHTSEEIKEVLREVKKPQYSKQNLLHFGIKKTSIFLFSKESGLILVNGNKWTGMEHISDRHSLTSRIPYWDEKGKLGNPSKLSLNVAPIEYLEYTLATNKDTGIVHTLYVSTNKKPFNKKKTLDLRQGWTNSSWDLMSGMETFEFGYYDINDIERFKVILRSSQQLGKDRWYVQINSTVGIPKLTTLIKESERGKQLETPFRMTQIDFTNITWIEREIKRMLNDKYEY